MRGVRDEKNGAIFHSASDGKINVRDFRSASNANGFH